MVAVKIEMEGSDGLIQADFRQQFLVFLKNNLFNILLSRRGVELALDSGNFKTS